MSDVSKWPGMPGLSAVGMAAGLCFLVSGCAGSLGDFGLERPQRPEMSAAALPPQAPPPPMQSAATTTVPLQPTALIEDGPATTATVAPATTGAFVPPGPPPNQPGSKLLTPEEKARAVAELEALAKSQKVAPAGGPSPSTRCTDETLDPAERLRREAEGLPC